MIPQYEISSSRLNKIARINHAKRYLEIGIWQGDTLRRVDVEEKIGVDPLPAFDWRAELAADFVIHEMSSDEYFSSYSSASFDLIFVDGLHTFEQSFRDFCTTLLLSNRKTVWVIDDTVPEDYASTMRTLERCYLVRRHAGAESVSWHGDVFKVIFAIHDFFINFDFRTIVDKGNPQTIVAFSPRSDFRPRWNSLEAISRLDYTDYLQNNIVQNFCSEDDALLWLAGLPQFA